jgi:type IV pilus assembly protein PilY1
MSASRLSHSSRLALAATLLALFTPGHGILAATDIADTPLASAASDDVKPNIFFVLDDSGSMAWDYMPNNSSNDPEYSTSAVGYRNHLCNFVYYNPAVNYEIPKNADGTAVYDSDQTSFTGAYSDGFYCYKNDCATNTQSKTNLSTSFKANSSDTAQAANYWKYLGDTAAPAWAAGTAYTAGQIRRPTTANGYVYTVRTAGTSGSTQPTWPTSDGKLVTDGTVIWVTGILPTNSVCDTSVSTSSQEICTDGSVTSSTCAAASKTALWRKVTVSSSSGPGTSDERQNFANWYTYYRNRMLMMKSSSGRAFAGVSDNYRVGFMTIHPGTFDSNGDANSSNVSASKFLKISDFNATHRASWYSKLYSQGTGSATPLRTALSVAGRYYAGKNNEINKGMVAASADDPVQYSCQQNFTILTTDGYWNDGDGKQVDGTTDMTNQDGNIGEQDAYNPAGNKFAVSPRPIHDGGSSVYNWNTASLEYRNGNCVFSTEQQKRIAQWQRRRADFSKCKTDGSSCRKLEFDCAGGTGDSGRPLCRVLNDSGWVNRATCDPGYNDPTTTLCRTTSDTGWVAAASCTPSAPTGGPETTCRSNDVPGYKLQYLATKAVSAYPGPNQGGSIIGTPTCTIGSWTDVVPATCSATPHALPLGGNGSTLACPPVGGQVVGSGPPDLPSGCAAWPCETSSATGGSSNTLADVAQHYYKTDLRTSALGNCTGSLGVSVCENNVPSTGTGAEDDKASWQHMTTFTMGLGLSGTLAFSPTYKTDSSGTFANIRAGSTNWPVPSADDPTALDDLWHAAVNGRGQYFSARDPASVIDGLTTALSGISARVASAAAAATSNLEPVAGDNFAYTAKYVTQKWTGELEAREIDLATGAVNSGTPIWSARDKLAEMTKDACDTRTIKLFRSGATNNLVDFKWNTDTCDATGAPSGTLVTTLNGAEKAHFDSSGADTTGATIDEVSLLSQYPNMSTGVSPSTVNQRSLAAGANLVNFVRGQRGKEGFDSGPPATADDANKLYRARDYVLGDIVNAQPVFVRAPFAQYTDAGYSAFRTAQANRTPIVYVAANDGMLHAFKAGTSISDTEGGKEAWAFMPSMVLPNLYKLASENYANNHSFYVDGTPTAADVFDPNTSTDCAATPPVNPQSCWKTIIVGGLNKGGQGYYALDVTNPASPKALWEFKNGATCIAVDATTKAPTTTAYSDCHLGYTFNNPIIGKLADGTWAVIVTSGHNNDDGVGYLYVLNAVTGKILYRISTGVGTAADPSGLNHINAWVDTAVTNNTIARVYGADLKGNIWRFDVNGTLAPAGREATLVAQAVDPGGSPQPITTRPELADVGGEPYVYVATGRYLGQTDKSDNQRQTVWAIKDPLTTTAVTNLRTTLASRTITNVGTGLTAYRKLSSTCTADSDGWYADLPDTGERANIDPKLQLGTLIVATNVPEVNACNVGGYGWLMFFNYKTGCAVAGSENESVGKKLAGGSGTLSLAVGTNVVRLPSGKTVVIVTTSAAEQITFNAPFSTPTPTGKRVSWREIID